MVVPSFWIRLRTVLGSFSVRLTGAAPLARFKVDCCYSVFFRLLLCRNSPQFGIDHTVLSSGGLHQRNAVHHHACRFDAHMRDSFSFGIIRLSEDRHMRLEPLTIEGDPCIGQSPAKLPDQGLQCLRLHRLHRRPASGKEGDGLFCHRTA